MGGDDGMGFVRMELDDGSEIPSYSRLGGVCYALDTSELVAPLSTSDTGDGLVMVSGLYEDATNSAMSLTVYSQGMEKVPVSRVNGLTREGFFVPQANDIPSLTSVSASALRSTEGGSEYDILFKGSGKWLRLTHTHSDYTISEATPPAVTSGTTYDDVTITPGGSGCGAVVGLVSGWEDSAQWYGDGTLLGTIRHATASNSFRLGSLVSGKVHYSGSTYHDMDALDSATYYTADSSVLNRVGGDMSHALMMHVTFNNSLGGTRAACGDVSLLVDDEVYAGPVTCAARINATTGADYCLCVASGFLYSGFVGVKARITRDGSDETTNEETVMIHADTYSPPEIGHDFIHSKYVASGLGMFPPWIEVGARTTSDSDPLGHILSLTRIYGEDDTTSLRDATTPLSINSYTSQGTARDYSISMGAPTLLSGRDRVVVTEADGTEWSPTLPMVREEGDDVYADSLYHWTLGRRGGANRWTGNQQGAVLYFPCQGDTRVSFHITEDSAYRSSVAETVVRPSDGYGTLYGDVYSDADSFYAWALDDVPLCSADRPTNLIQMRVSVTGTIATYYDNQQVTPFPYPVLALPQSPVALTDASVVDQSVPVTYYGAHNVTRDYLLTKDWATYVDGALHYREDILGVLDDSIGSQGWDGTSYPESGGRVKGMMRSDPLHSYTVLVPLRKYGDTYSTYLASSGISDGSLFRLDGVHDSSYVGGANTGVYHSRLRLSRGTTDAAWTDKYMAVSSQGGVHLVYADNIRVAGPTGYTTTNLGSLVNMPISSATVDLDVFSIMGYNASDPFDPSISYIPAWALSSCNGSYAYGGFCLCQGASHGSQCARSLPSVGSYTGVTSLRLTVLSGDGEVVYTGPITPWDMDTDVSGSTTTYSDVMHANVHLPYTVPGSITVGPYLSGGELGMYMSTGAREVSTINTSCPATEVFASPLAADVTMYPLDKNSALSSGQNTDITGVVDIGDTNTQEPSDTALISLRSAASCSLALHMTPTISVPDTSTTEYSRLYKAVTVSIPAASTTVADTLPVHILSGHRVRADNRFTEPMALTVSKDEDLQFLISALSPSVLPTSAFGSVGHTGYSGVLQYPSTPEGAHTVGTFTHTISLPSSADADAEYGLYLDGLRCMGTETGNGLTIEDSDGYTVLSLSCGAATSTSYADPSGGQVTGSVDTSLQPHLKDLGSVVGGSPLLLTGQTTVTIESGSVDYNHPFGVSVRWASAPSIQECTVETYTAATSVVVETAVRVANAACMWYTTDADTGVVSVETSTPTLVSGGYSCQYYDAFDTLEGVTLGLATDSGTLLSTCSYLMAPSDTDLESDTLTVVWDTTEMGVVGVEGTLYATLYDAYGGIVSLDGTGTYTIDYTDAGVAQTVTMSMCEDSSGCLGMLNGSLTLSASGAYSFELKRDAASRSNWTSATVSYTPDILAMATPTLSVSVVTDLEASITNIMYEVDVVDLEGTPIDSLTTVKVIVVESGLEIDLGWVTDTYTVADTKAPAIGAGLTSLTVYPQVHGVAYFDEAVTLSYSSGGLWEGIGYTEVVTDKSTYSEGETTLITATMRTSQGLAVECDSVVAAFWDLVASDMVAEVSLVQVGTDLWSGMHILPAGTYEMYIQYVLSGDATQYSTSAMSDLVNVSTTTMANRAVATYSTAPIAGESLTVTASLYNALDVLIPIASSDNRLGSTVMRFTFTRDTSSPCYNWGDLSGDVIVEDVSLSTLYTDSATVTVTFPSADEYTLTIGFYDASDNLEGTVSVVTPPVTVSLPDITALDPQPSLYLGMGSPSILVTADLAPMPTISVLMYDLPLNMEGFKAHIRHLESGSDGPEVELYTSSARYAMDLPKTLLGVHGQGTYAIYVTHVSGLLLAEELFEYTANCSTSALSVAGMVIMTHSPSDAADGAVVSTDVYLHDAVGYVCTGVSDVQLSITNDASEESVYDLYEVASNPGHYAYYYTMPVGAATFKVMVGGTVVRTEVKAA
ncbi:hypothetical protein KIPB_005064 [Kipferlia bialata]|uniref:Uncharacterized protein n=1 Tax=Kipferlia bialata TaxID=797122 RepID=A0A9K3CWG9_9EUKA|nr:hypothetical protein KIPB_005064 [Kipferlia bialata]|eukprot:g5064.t1